MSLIVALGVLLGVAWQVLQAPEVGTPSRLSFDLDTTNQFDFCACPTGTNWYRNVCVTITHPYWLATTPVTRRQWFAERGEPLSAWRGGEDAPMTYVSRDEVTNFCARLNARWAGQLPPGYEIRLPTVAEWRLAYAAGQTATNAVGLERMAKRRLHETLGWFGQGLNGENKFANMKRYYEERNYPVPMVTNLWPEFPPHRIESKDACWVRRSSQFAPVPVGLRPANALGLYDMLGNCLERAYDGGSTNVPNWGASEFGLRADPLYVGQGLSVANPVERGGSQPLMLGTYFTPELAGDDVWAAPFDRLPHLGFRLCIGPKLD